MDEPALFDYYGDVYGPGPMVLFRQLEVLTSREQVLAAIKSVLGEPRALASTSVIAALETSTGPRPRRRTPPRGSAAAARPTWPRYDARLHAGAERARSRSMQINETPNARGCKFHVALKGANPTDVQLVEVDTFRNGVDQTLQVPTPAFTVTSLELDPLHECLVFLASSSPRTIVIRLRIGVRITPWLSGRAVR